MNIRKPIDYNDMYVELDAAMKAGLPQMDLYCEIGRTTSNRPEKGAAVAAAEYLQNSYPEVTGFSPRNVRRMREFYRTYESAPELLGEAMMISWTQNVVILEAELSPTERAWYIRAIKHFNWSKLELMANIKNHAHKTSSLPCNGTSIETEIQNTLNNTNNASNSNLKKVNADQSCNLHESANTLKQINCCRYCVYPDDFMISPSTLNPLHQTTPFSLGRNYRWLLITQNKCCSSWINRLISPSTPSFHQLQNVKKF